MRCRNIRIHVEIPVDGAFTSAQHSATVMVLSTPLKPFGNPVKISETYPSFNTMNTEWKRSLVLRSQSDGIRMALLRWTDYCYLAGQMKLSSLGKMIALFQWSLARLESGNSMEGKFL